MYAFWDTLWRQVLENVLKKGVFMCNFYFGKCLQNTCKNRLKMNAFCMRFKRFFGDKFGKNGQKTAFLWAIFSLLNVCKTLGKTVLKWKYFACGLIDFVGIKLKKKKREKTVVLWAIFTLVKLCKIRAKTVLKLIHFACVLRHILEQNLKKKTV